MVKVIKFVLLLLVTSMLSACLGGSIVQQIASSIMTKAADKAVAVAMDVDEDTLPRERNGALKDKEPDELWMALATSSFRTSSANGADYKPQSPAKPEETTIGILHGTSLVRVEVFNLIIGDEKITMFERARAIGALNLPKQREWPSWQIATGAAENSRQLITFLIPPKFGKLPSGSLTIVELASAGNLNIARYTVEVELAQLQ